MMLIKRTKTPIKGIFKFLQNLMFKKLWDPFSNVPIEVVLVLVALSCIMGIILCGANLKRTKTSIKDLMRLCQF